MFLLFAYFLPCFTAVALCFVLFFNQTTTVACLGKSTL